EFLDVEGGKMATDTTGSDQGEPGSGAIERLTNAIKNAKDELRGLRQDLMKMRTFLERLDFSGQTSTKEIVKKLHDDLNHSRELGREMARTRKLNHIVIDQMRAFVSAADTILKHGRSVNG